MKKFLRECSFLLDAKIKRDFPILFLIFFSSSFLDVVGISLVGIFLLFIINFNKMMHKLPLNLSHFLLNHFSKNEIIFLIGFALVFAFIVKAFWGIYSQKKITKFTCRFAVRLQTRLISGYQNAAYPFHLKQNSAYIMNKVALVGNFSGNVVAALLNILSSMFVILGVIACLAIIHPILTLLLTFMIGLIFVLYEIFMKSSVMKMGKTIAVFGGEINKAVLQSLNGLKEIRVLGKEIFFLNKIKIIAEDYSSAVATYGASQIIPRYAVESFVSIFLVAAVLGALLSNVDPVNMIPVLGIFAAACVRLLPTISQLIGQFTQLRSAGYVTSMLYNEIDEVENRYKTNLKDSSTSECYVFSQFSLNNISFHYDAMKHDALRNINLTIFRGQSVGFIGASGAGKSTLVNIILGLLLPDSGKLLADGLPIENLRKWLNNFAYIPQTIFLLDDTLKRNIAMGIEDHEIDDKKLNCAIEMSQLVDVVADLPDGVNTIIGENGTRLSGGQRQRVALARALYFEREIIVMDEATSSLDNETEHEVINAIKKLHGIKTLIVVAHRLSTIQHCDVIYKLEKGRVIAKGAFNEVVVNKDAITSNVLAGDKNE